MGVITIERRQPVPAPIPRDDEPRDPAIGAAVLKFLFWTVTTKPLAQGIVLAVLCAYWLWNQTYQGRFRYHLRPLWVAGLAWYVTPWTAWTWVAAGLLLEYVPNPGRWGVSALEQKMLAKGCALAAAFQVLEPGLDWRLQAGLFTELAILGLLPWWISRAWALRRAPEAAGPHPLEMEWEDRVALSPKAGDLAGSVLTMDPDHDDRGRLQTIPGALSTNVASADELACSLLGRDRGTVTISEDPSRTSLDFLVGFPTRWKAGEVRYWDPPAVTDDFTWDTGDSLDGRALPCMIAQRGGAVNVVVIAKSGSGKGSILRQVGLVAARHPKVFLAVNDCKGEEEGGAGVPELRAGADAYGRTADQWRAIACMKMEIFAARASRYGKPGVGRPFWHPDAPVDGYTDPLFVHVTDEFRRFLDTHPAMRDAWEQMTAAQRSLGMQDTVSTQRGAGADLATTRAKNDLRGNGIVYIGAAGDDTSARIASSDFGVNLSKLPQGQGWFYVQSTIASIASIPVRIRVIPTVEEARYLGFDSPHGTVEDWLAPGQVHHGLGALHPQDRDIVERWRPEFEGDTTRSAPVEAPIEEPVREVIQVADGAVVVEEPPRLSIVPDPQPDTTPALTLIPEIVGEAVMTRGEIAEAGGWTPEYTSERLKKLEAMGKMARAVTDDGRSGWRRVA